MAFATSARSPKRAEEKLHVGRFAASSAGSGELDEGPEELHVLDDVEFRSLRATSGMERKKAKFSRSCSEEAAAATC